MPDRTVKISKFLSLVLRHKPETIGLTLDPAGWVSVVELLRACEKHDFPLSREELEAGVATNDKQRFSLSEDGQRIRANQGHSVEVELGYQPAEPPEFLYHGTVERFVPSIRAKGLLKGQRHHVHLSPDITTAAKVGSRRGKPVILTVSSGRMYRAGYRFYQSANGVWLTDRVPTTYITEEIVNSQLSIANKD
ncbi:MAG: RNA 2'-phosphotransferase [Anaerolineales bacterium]|nr:RNA 2'-phosphotransferase [Anaerolineales bacterium]